MKSFNLLNIVTAVALIAICSAPSAEPLENASSLEAPISDTATETSIIETEPASYSITEPEADKIIEEGAASPDAFVAEPISDIEYTCEHNTSKRIIRVFKNTAAGLACEVSYEKSTGTQTLWTAKNDPEYCAEKAADFAAKQAGWGWFCMNQDGEVVAAPLDAPAEEVSLIEAPTEEMPAIEAEPAAIETPVDAEAIEENIEVEAPANE
jgi:hypothetical protein